MAIREESYADFSRRVHGNAAKKRIPVNVTYDVTYRCNLNCRHCYCNLPANDKAAKASELKLDEIERILTEARDLGALWILLTGGEPLLRPDFRDIYLTVLRLGLIPTVFTNGTLVTEEWADFFAEHRPFKMEITLYGSCTEVYERVTRTPGSFERCMRGVRLLKGRGVEPRLKTMVLRSNIEDLDNTRAIAMSLGLEFRLDPVVLARHPDLPRQSDVDPREERITVEEAFEVERSDPKRRAAWEKLCSQTVSAEPAEPERLLPCAAGKSSCNIAPDGTVRACGMLRFVGWRGRLRDIWTGELLEHLEAPARGPARCSRCQLAAVCNHCIGVTWAEHGSFDRVVDYVCEIAHKRAELRRAV